jgi:hypothetical protein
MTDLVVDGLAREVLISETAKLRVDGLAREVLISETAKLRVDGLVREVLRTSTTLAPLARNTAVTVIT